MRPHRPARALLLLAAGIAAQAAAPPALAQGPAWKEACLAIRPAAACTPDNRPAVEDAMRECRGADDKPACHRRHLTRLQERPAGPPTVFRGARTK